MRNRHRSDAAPWLAERGWLFYNALPLPPYTVNP